MWIHDVKLEKYRAIAAEGEPMRLGTSDSQGNEQLRINCGEGWEDLAVRVIFRPCKVEKVVFDDGIVDVPWEATKNPLTASKGKIVFRGLSEDGRVINTLDLPYCVEGHSPVVGREENEYTPGIVDQYVNQVREDSQAAQQAAKDAAASQSAAAQNAAAAAHSAAAAATSAQTAKETADRIEAQTKQYADAAAASAQEAKETADGIEERTKQYADSAAASASAASASAAKAEAAAEEVAQIAKDGPVVSVNGKTGRVKLEAEDLPFDNAGTPFLSTTVQDAIEELLLIGGGGASVSVIRVTAPAGAVVTVKKDAKVYTQTVDSYGTELSFMVLETGTWDVSAVWNDLQDARSINIAEAGGTYSVVLDFAPFRAYIHVTARAGAVVTASKGELVVSDTVPGSDVTLTVPDKGQWSLSATYDGGNAIPVVVDVQEEEATYEAELHFLVITVTAPAGAAVTAVKDGDTIQRTAEAGTVDLYLTGPGLWTVSAVYEGAASQAVTVEVNAGQYTYTAEPAFATLEVTAPAGSTIQARNGQSLLTKTAETGSVLFYLPALGTWELTATLGDKQATSSVECLAYQKYTSSISYFSATIQVTAPEGAAVKATKGSAAVEGTAGPDGAVLTVEEAGEWEITATYADGIAQPVTVNVLASGETYTAEAKFCTLTVTVDAGSTVEIKNGDTTLTGTADGGSVKFWLPNTGVWTVKATLNGQTANGSVDCAAYQDYNTELAYFSATIKATAVQGATVKAVLDDYSVSGEAGSDGTVTLTVTKPGSYTVNATYKNALSNSKAVQVSESGQEYPVSVEFITLTVTAPEGSAITAKNGAATLTDTGGTVKFWLPNTGAWTVTASLGGDSTSSEIQCSAYQNYSVELSYGPPEDMNDATWAELHELSASGKLGDYYDVGDEKTIVLNGTVDTVSLSNFEISAFILEFNHNSSLEGSNLTHFAIGKVNGKITAFSSFKMNSSPSNSGGWKSSRVRKTILGNDGTPSSPATNSLMSALPSDLRNVIQTVTKYTNNVGQADYGNSSAVTATEDYLWILSEYEAVATTSYSLGAEASKQAQYEYFKTGNSAGAYDHIKGSAIKYLSRSSYYRYSDYICVISNHDDGTAGSTAVTISTKCGLLACFAI